MGSRPDALNAAIDGAWLAFNMPAPRDLGLCTQWSIEPATADKILATPARKLSAEQIRLWYGAEFRSEPQYAQVAWLLPRIFELLAEGVEVASVGNEVAFQRLQRTGFPERWPERQVTAINDFALAYVDFIVCDANRFIEINLDRMLCMFGMGGIDLVPLLARLEALSDDDLACLLHNNWFHHGWGAIPQNNFWSQERGLSIVYNWYVSKTLQMRMEQAAMNGNDNAFEIHALISRSMVQDKS